MSTPTNSLNIAQAGIVTFNGTNTLTGQALTSHGTLVAGAANAITSVAPSATVGFVLTSNGSAADPSYQVGGTVGAFSSVVVQTFTVSGTYTPTPGMKYCIIEIVGGGGGGGSNAQGGGGGGGGGYARQTVPAGTVGVSQVVTIGPLGTGGVGGNGAAGGTTSVGAIITATGGGGGGNIGGTIGTGGAGGLGASGDINSRGGAGGSGAGPGADSFFGGGARTSTNGSVLAGGNYGGGGGGGIGSSVNGGNGSPGFCIITEYL